MEASTVLSPTVGTRDAGDTCDAVGGDDDVARNPSAQPLERLEAYLCQHAANLTAAEYRWLTVLAEFDRRRGWEPWECRSCADWLSWHAGLDIRAAREKVRVARKLGEFPLLADAMSVGQLSYSKLRAVSRIATPRTEAELLQIATAATTSQVEAMVSAYRRASPNVNLSYPDSSDPDSSADTQPEPEQWLHRTCNPDGTTTISIRLPDEAAATFLSAVEAFAEPGTGATKAVRRSHAAVAMAEFAHAHRQCDDTIANTQSQYLVVLHTDGRDMCEIEGADDTIGDPRGITPDTALRMLCDADVEAIVGDKSTASGRAATPAMSYRRGIVTGRLRRYILNRDRTCRFPGCTHRARVDIHHIVHREHGGDNHPDNLVALCRFHHHRMHEHGWHIERTPNGLVFLDRAGRIAPEHPEPRDGDPHTVSSLGRTEHDGRSQWDGSRLNAEWVVAGLLATDQHTSHEARTTPTATSMATLTADSLHTPCTPHEARTTEPRADTVAA